MIGSNIINEVFGLSSIKTMGEETLQNIGELIKKLKRQKEKLYSLILKKHERGAENE